jgi:hypothetical protein
MITPAYSTEADCVGSLDQSLAKRSEALFVTPALVQSPPHGTES